MPTFDAVPVVPLLAQAGLLGIVAPALCGLALGMLIWWTFRALTTEDLAQDAEWRYDVTRINALRRLDTIYRVFQTPIGLLSRINRFAFREALPEIHRELQAGGLPRYWLAEEYLARCEMIGILLLPIFGLICVRMMGPAGVVTAIFLSAIAIYLARRNLAKLAARRLVLIKRRMPFFLDLLTLLMEAGASFLDALKQAVKEFQGHAISVEFGRVLTDMNMGKTRGEAFDSLRRRLSDDEINTIVGAILQSEQLGTPLSHIFRSQADLLRVKRSQRAETIANEAGVKMLLPGVLVMAAAVLIILGPFSLNYLIFGL